MSGFARNIPSGIIAPHHRLGINPQDFGVSSDFGELSRVVER